MRLLICGDRNWTDNDYIYRRLKALQQGYLAPPALWMIHGGAKGADTAAQAAAILLGIPYDVYPAEWDKYGRAAGPIRNQQMLDSGVDEVWAFHHDLSQSKGTAHMVGIARKAGVPTVVFPPPTDPPPNWQLTLST